MRLYEFYMGLHGFIYILLFLFSCFCFLLYNSGSDLMYRYVGAPTNRSQ